MAVDLTRLDEYAHPAHYEELHQALRTVWSYPIVRAVYAHTMPQASAYAARLLGEDPKQRYNEWLAKLQNTFAALERAGVRSYGDFIERAKPEAFPNLVAQTGDDPRELVGALKYLNYWALPTLVALREFAAPDDADEKVWIAALAKIGVRSAPDLFQQGRTPAMRATLAAAIGAPEAFLHDLAKRADFSRMPYTRAKTIRHYRGAGFDTVTDFARVDAETLREAAARYSEAIGMNLKSAVDFQHGRLIAAAIPPIFEF